MVLSRILTPPSLTPRPVFNLSLCVKPCTIDRKNELTALIWKWSQLRTTQRSVALVVASTLLRGTLSLLATPRKQGLELPLPTYTLHSRSRTCLPTLAAVPPAKAIVSTPWHVCGPRTSSPTHLMVSANAPFELVEVPQINNLGERPTPNNPSTRQRSCRALDGNRSIYQHTPTPNQKLV